MITTNNNNMCSGCHACVNICPKKCIEMKSDDEGFWYPIADKDKCINCGLCDKICPILHPIYSKRELAPTALAAVNTNDEIRLKSSSGGIFTLLAEWIIKQGGVVFGAAFTNDYKAVHHIAVDTVEELEKLRGSKYVQSLIGDTYKQAKGILESGRAVLFTGTPCQISGLYSFLQKDYDNLYTQDIICHGVPSPMVWRKYVEEREKEASSQTFRMSFRCKSCGWTTYSTMFEYKNHSKYQRLYSEDPYMKTFLSDMCLRPSCYNCSFKGVSRKSDLTLADFWGIQNVCQEMDDHKGTSAVLIHSEKGHFLLNSIKSSISSREVPLESIVRYNPSLVRSSAMPEKRSEYMSQIQSESVCRLADEYFKVSFKKRLLNALRRNKALKSIWHKINR